MLLDLYPQRSYAPSGMRRLMMYQLQEESLKADDEKKRIAEAVKEQVVEKLSPSVKKPAKKKVQRKVEKEPELVLPKLKPIHRKPKQQAFENLHQVLFVLSLEMQQWIFEFQPYLYQFNQLKINQQIEAANDADIRLRLLLLAA